MSEGWSGVERRQNPPIAEAIDRVRSLHTTIDTLASSVAVAALADATGRKRVMRSQAFTGLLIGVLAVLVTVLLFTSQTRALAQHQHDFARVHAQASYDRAVITLRAMQCEASWFATRFGADPNYPTAKLEVCFLPILPPPSIGEDGPLPKEVGQEPVNAPPPQAPRP